MLFQGENSIREAPGALARACHGPSFFETLSGGTGGTGGGACSGGGPRHDAGRTSTCTESVRDKVWPYNNIVSNTLV